VRSSDGWLKPSWTEISTEERIFAADLLQMQLQSMGSTTARFMAVTEAVGGVHAIMANDIAWHEKVGKYAHS
jgi:putative heme degradation protein